MKSEGIRTMRGAGKSGALESPALSGEFTGGNFKNTVLGHTQHKAGLWAHFNP